MFLSRRCALLAALLPGVALADAPAPTLSDSGARLAEPAHVSAQPCRPTVACTAQLVPAGAFEVEAGYGARAASGASLVHSGQLLLKYSVLDSLQLQLGTAGLFVAGEGLRAHGFDGLTPGVKWRFLDGEGLLPVSAVSFHVDLPTSTALDAQQRTVDLELWVYFSRDFGKLHGDLNLAVRLWDVTSPALQGLVASSWSFPLAAGFSAFTELYTAVGGGRAPPVDGGWLSGINYSPVEEVIFDVGADLGFYPGTRAFSVFAGVTFVPGARPHGPPLALAGRPEAVAGR